MIIKNQKIWQQQLTVECGTHQHASNHKTYISNTICQLDMLLQRCYMSSNRKSFSRPFANSSLLSNCPSRSEMRLVMQFHRTHLHRSFDICSTLRTLRTGKLPETRHPLRSRDTHPTSNIGNKACWRGTLPTHYSSCTINTRGYSTGKHHTCHSGRCQRQVRHVQSCCCCGKLNAVLHGTAWQPAHSVAASPSPSLPSDSHQTSFKHAGLVNSLDQHRSSGTFHQESKQVIWTG